MTTEIDSQSYSRAIFYNITIQITTIYFFINKVEIQCNKTCIGTYKTKARRAIKVYSNY